MRYLRDTHSLPNPLLEFLCDALSLVDVDADTFTKHNLHGGRMTESYDHLKPTQAPYRLTK